MEPLLLLWCVVVGLYYFRRSMAARAKAKEEHDILVKYPESWKVKKQLEMEEQDRKRRAAGGAAFSLLKILMGSWPRKR